MTQIITNALKHLFLNLLMVVQSYRIELTVTISPVIKIMLFLALIFILILGRRRVFDSWREVCMIVLNYIAKVMAKHVSGYAELCLPHF